MGITRKFKEEPLRQGSNEEVSYTLTTTPWGSSPTNAVCRVMLVGGLTDSNLLSGACTIAGDVITTGQVQNLIKDKKYEIQIQFTIGGTTVFEAYGEIHVDN